MLSREERILSEILVSRGLVGRDVIEDCARVRRSVTPTRSLVDALIDTGGLDRGEGERAAEEAQALDRSLEPDLPTVGKLGEFRLIREIGRGGMGIVYEAEQESLSRRVALKVLPAGAALDERLAVRFLREARAAGRLHHPGIVSIFTSGRAEGVLFFAMEMIDGVSLADAVARGPMAPSEAARIAAAVARALEYAHQSGLVHRDIKPENILLGEDGEPRITDFGLVHEMSGATFTLAHHVLGTPAFIPPEQALGERVDPRSDVYSLGAVLYTMLCGHPPYPGDVPSAILGRVLAGAPPSVRSIRPEIPGDLSAVCERAMARIATDRYASALDMADDLERFLRGDRVLAKEFGVSARSEDDVASSAESMGGISLVQDRRGGASSDRDPGGNVSGDSDPIVNASGDRHQGGKGSLDGEPGGNAPGHNDSGGEASRAGELRHELAIEAVFLSSGASDELTTGFLDQGQDSLRRDLEPGGTGLYGAAPRERAVRMDPRPVEGLAGDRPFPGRDLAGALEGVPDGPVPRATHAQAGAAGVAGARLRFGVAASLAAGLVALVAVGTVLLNPFTAGSGEEANTPISNHANLTVLVSDPGRVAWPAWSPDGRSIAYASNATGRWDIYLADPAQGAPVNLTHGSFGPSASPSFSPDGRLLAYESWTKDGAGVFLQDLSTGKTRRLTTFGHAPVWSAEGGEIAFMDTAQAIGVRGTMSRLWIVTVATERVRPLTGIDGSFPSYSPNSRFIAFSSQSGGQADIWTIAADGGAAVRVTDDAAFDWCPAWSADGTHLYFGSDRGGSYGLWSVRMEEASGRPMSPPRSVSDTAFSAPFYLAISRRSDRVALVSLAEEGRIHRITLAPDLTGIQGVPEALRRHAPAASYPDIAPDGTLVAFTAVVPDEAIAVAPADGASSPRILTSGGSRNRGPRWSPDGERIAFSSNRDGILGVWSMKRDGSDPLRLSLRDGSESSSPVWSPDGARLAYSVRGAEARIVKIGADAAPAGFETLPRMAAPGPAFEPWSWSPGGDTIAGTAGGIALYSLLDRSYRHLTDFGVRPSWTPDGRRLLFTAAHQLYVLDIRTGRSRVLYDASPNDLLDAFTIAKDGRTVYAVLAGSCHEIWEVGLRQEAGLKE